MHLNGRSDGKGVLIDYTGSADRHARHAYPLSIYSTVSEVLFPHAFIFVPSLLLYGRGEAPRKGGESLNDVIVVLECLGHSSGVVPRRRSSNIGSLAAFALPFL